jgi:hypothetical protein
MEYLFKILARKPEMERPFARPVLHGGIIYKCILSK